MNALFALALLLQAQPTTEPAAPAPAEQAAPAQPAATQPTVATDENGRPIWQCRREVFTGSHRSQRVCRLVEEVDEVSERTGERMRRMRATIRPSVAGE
jgi:hypothetical protein